jgi:hypothetical protein
MHDTFTLLMRIFGGTRAIADATGVTQGAVRAWRMRDSIPARHIAALLREAKRQGYRLTAADLFRGRR